MDSDSVIPIPRRSARLGNASPPTTTTTTTTTRSSPSSMHTTTSLGNGIGNALPAKRKRTISSSSSGGTMSSKRTHLAKQQQQQPSSTSSTATPSEEVKVASRQPPLPVQTARAKRHVRRHPSVFDVDEDAEKEKEKGREEETHPVASTSYLPTPTPPTPQAKLEVLRKRGKKENVVTKEMMLMEKNGGAVLTSRRTSLRASTRLAHHTLPATTPSSKMSKDKGKAPLVPVRIPSASNTNASIPLRSTISTIPSHVHSSELHEGDLESKSPQTPAAGRPTPMPEPTSTGYLTRSQSRNRHRTNPIPSPMNVPNTSNHSHSHSSLNDSINNDESDSDSEMIDEMEQDSAQVVQGSSIVYNTRRASKGRAATRTSASASSSAEAQIGTGKESAGGTHPSHSRNSRSRSRSGNSPPDAETPLNKRRGGGGKRRKGVIVESVEKEKDEDDMAVDLHGGSEAVSSAADAAKDEDSSSAPLASGPGIAIAIAVEHGEEGLNSVPVGVSGDGDRNLVDITACEGSYAYSDDATQSQSLTEPIPIQGDVEDTDMAMIVDGGPPCSSSFEEKPPMEWVQGGQPMFGSSPSAPSPSTPLPASTPFPSELDSDSKTFSSSQESSQELEPLNQEDESESLRGRSLMRSRRLGMKRSRRGGSRRMREERERERRGGGGDGGGGVGGGGCERKGLVSEKAPDSLWRAACRFRVDVLSSQYSTRLAEYETDRAHEFFFTAASSSPSSTSAPTSTAQLPPPFPYSSASTSSLSVITNTQLPSPLSHSSSSVPLSPISQSSPNIQSIQSIRSVRSSRSISCSPTWHFTMHWEDRRHDAGDWDGKVDDMHPSSSAAAAAHLKVDSEGQMHAGQGEMEVDFRDEDCYDWELCETDSSSGSDEEGEGEGEGENHVRSSSSNEDVKSDEMEEDDDSDEDDIENSEAEVGLVEGEMQLDFKVTAPVSSTAVSPSTSTFMCHLATPMQQVSTSVVSPVRSTSSSLADALTPLEESSAGNMQGDVDGPTTGAFALAVYEHDQREEAMSSSTVAPPSPEVDTSDSSSPTSNSHMFTPLSVPPTSLSISHPQPQPAFPTSSLSFFQTPPTSPSQYPQPLPLPPPPLSSIPVRDLGLRDMDQFTTGFDEELPGQITRVMDRENFGSWMSEQGTTTTPDSFARINDGVGDTESVSLANMRLLTPYERRLNYRSKRLGSIARGTPIDPDRRRRFVAWVESRFSVENARSSGSDVDSEMKTTTMTGQEEKLYPRIGSSAWYAMRFPPLSRSPRSRSRSLSSSSSTPYLIASSSGPSSPDTSLSMSTFLQAQRQEHDQDMVMFETMRAPDSMESFDGNELEGETEESLGIGQYGDLRAVVRWREARAVVKRRMMMIEDYKLENDNPPQPLQPDDERGTFEDSMHPQFQHTGGHDGSYSPRDAPSYSADIGDGLSDEDAEGDVDPDVAEPVPVSSFDVVSSTTAAASPSTPSMNSGTNAKTNDQESTRSWENCFDNLTESGTAGRNQRSISNSGSGSQANNTEGLLTPGAASTVPHNDAFDRRTSLLPATSSQGQDQINAAHFHYSPQSDISHGNENVSASSNVGANAESPSDAGMYGMVNMGMGMGMGLGPLRVPVPGLPAGDINTTSFSGTTSVGFGFVGVGVGMGLGVDVMGMGMGMSMGLGLETDPWFFPSSPSSASSQSSPGGDSQMQQLQVIQAQQLGPLAGRGPLGFGMNLGVPMDIDSSVIPSDQPMEGIRFGSAGATESAYPLGFAMG